MAAKEVNKGDWFMTLGIGLIFLGGLVFILLVFGNLFRGASIEDALPHRTANEEILEVPGHPHRIRTPEGWLVIINRSTATYIPDKDGTWLTH